MTKLLIILNPWAGRGTAGRRRPEIEAALRESGADYSVLTTHARGGATELAWQGVEHGYDRIVAIGGDGTINEVVNGIKGAEANLGRRARLGIIPLGTGSDFIKVLDGFEANDIAGGVRRAVGDRARPIDLGRAQVGDDQLRVAQTAATIVLFIVAMWILSILARPLVAWRLGLLVAMVVAFIGILAIPGLRSYFAIELPDRIADLAVVGIAAIACAVLELGWRLTGWKQQVHGPDADDDGGW